MKTTALFVLMVIVISTSAQNKKTPNPVADKNQLVYQGFLIKVSQQNVNSFGYSVYSRGQLVILQVVNPFTLSPLGLSNKEDAFKIAKWQIDQLHMSGNVNLNTNVKTNQQISPEVATQLGISIPPQTNHKK